MRTGAAASRRSTTGRERPAVGPGRGPTAILPAVILMPFARIDGIPGNAPGPPALWRTSPVAASSTYPKHPMATTPLPGSDASKPDHRHPQPSSSGLLISGGHQLGTHWWSKPDVRCRLRPTSCRPPGGPLPGRRGKRHRPGWVGGSPSAFGYAARQCRHISCVNHQRINIFHLTDSLLMLCQSSLRSLYAGRRSRLEAVYEEEPCSRSCRT